MYASKLEIAPTEDSKFQMSLKLVPLFGWRYSFILKNEPNVTSFLPIVNLSIHDLTLKISLHCIRLMRFFLGSQKIGS